MNEIVACSRLATIVATSPDRFYLIAASAIEMVGLKRQRQEGAETTGDDLVRNEVIYPMRGWEAGADVSAGAAKANEVAVRAIIANNSQDEAISLPPPLKKITASVSVCHNNGLLITQRHKRCMLQVSF